MKWWGFDLDKDFEDLWHSLEAVQDGECGHRIAMRGETAINAALTLAERLAPAIAARMYASDAHGAPVEEGTSNVA